MTVRTFKAKDKPEGWSEFRVASHDSGRTWWAIDEIPNPANPSGPRENHWFEISSDLFAQVEVTGATERNLIGRILIAPPDRCSFDLYDDPESPICDRPAEAEIQVEGMPRCFACRDHHRQLALALIAKGIQFTTRKIQDTGGS